MAEIFQQPRHRRRSGDRMQPAGFRHLEISRRKQFLQSRQRILKLTTVA